MKFTSYKCKFIGKINEIHILINEKSNREIPEFSNISRVQIQSGSRDLVTCRVLRRNMYLRINLRFLSNWKECDRNDSFPFDYIASRIPFG